MKIRIISGAEPYREGEYPNGYMIGSDGVTEIVEQHENLGSYAITWFVVKSGDSVIAKMNALHVEHVGYVVAEANND